MTTTSNTSLPCADAKMKPYDIAIAMDQVMTMQVSITVLSMFLADSMGCADIYLD